MRTERFVPRGSGRIDHGGWWRKYACQKGRKHWVSQPIRLLQSVCIIGNTKRVSVRIRISRGILPGQIRFILCAKRLQGYSVENAIEKETWDPGELAFLKQHEESLLVSTLPSVAAAGAYAVAFLSGPLGFSSSLGGIAQRRGIRHVRRQSGGNFL